MDGYVPKERFDEIISKSEQRAREQLDLIADLLDLARLQEPKKENKTEPSDIAAILRDVLDMMQERITGKNLLIDVIIEPGNKLVMVPKKHVRQIWNNLVSNAVKYTPEGGSISITLREKAKVIFGSVQDTGIGISPEEQEFIFENFYRTEAAKGMSRHGTGLGLSIVKGIMERYGGRIWLESEAGQGSTFFSKIPKI